VSKIRARANASVPNARFRWVRVNRRESVSPRRRRARVKPQDGMRGVGTGLEVEMAEQKRRRKRWREGREGRGSSCPVRFKRRINSILMFRAIPQTEARAGDSF